MGVRGGAGGLVALTVVQGEAGGAEGTAVGAGCDVRCSVLEAIRNIGVAGPVIG